MSAAHPVVIYLAASGGFLLGFLACAILTASKRFDEDMDRIGGKVLDD